ncbi:TRAP transporter large permease [Desulfatiglans anilini]|uniref:TRAP transporter large permease n=1 Tax=Desulfatiglans anilini TaxID=90728 RepID=UPI0003F4D2E6|nr:TRAP transporter large permease subunit [Desulfatiglans anilini]
MDIIALVVVLLASFLLTVPIGFAFIATTILLMLLFTNLPYLMVAEGLFSKLDSFPLEAVLFFILLGNIMKEGKSSRYLIDFTKALMYRVPGGLGIAGVMACAIFGAISGSATATVVAIGAIMVPAMAMARYEKAFAVGLLTTASILGVIIPPSILMILYSVVANVSMAKLFLGGFIPGLILAAGLSIYTAIVCKRHGYGVQPGANDTLFGPDGLVGPFKKAFWALILPFLILGGIYGGVFTPTEAAVVGCVYAIIIELFIYRTLHLKSIIGVLKTSGITTGALLITLAGACIFTDYLTLKQIPQDLSAFVVENISSQYVFLLFINVFFLFLGTFIDPLSAIIVVTPLLMPTVTALNIDPIFLGVILTINLGIGYCTPPLGANLFVAALVMDEAFSRIAMAVIPAILICLLVLAILNVFPAVVMFLPNLFM